LDTRTQHGAAGLAAALPRPNGWAAKHKERRGGSGCASIRVERPCRPTFTWIGPAVALIVGLLFNEAPAWAGICTWKNPAVDSSWSNSSNWNTGGGASCPPTSTADAATFNAGSSPCTIDVSGIASNFTINGYTGTITQSAALTLNGTFQQSSGTFNQSAPLTVGGAFIESGGTFIGSSGLLKIDVNGSLNLMSGTFTSTNGRLEVGGTFNNTGGTFDPNNGQFMVNHTSGTSTINSSGMTFYDLIVNDGLAGYWKLDEASGTSAADVSGYGNTGTLQNSPSWATSGLPAVTFHDPSAVTLNGTNQYVDVATPATTSNLAFTACGRVKFSGLSGAHTIVSETGTQSSAFILKRDSGGKFAFLMTGSDVASPTNYQTLGTTTAVTGTWYHVCGVYNGSTGTLYVNGSAEGTPVTVSNKWAATSRTYIGASRWGGAVTDYVPGTIDDVRIYSRALSAASINALYLGDPPAGAATQIPSGALTVAHDLVIASGTLSAGTNAVTVGGSWWNYGGVFSGTGTVTFNGTGTNNFIRSGGQSFRAISVTGSGTWTLGDALSMSTRIVTVSAGTLTGLSYSITAGTITESGGGNFIPGTGPITLDGSSDATLPDGSYGALTIDTSEPNLAGYWKLDEGSGSSFSDSSGNGNTGTLFSSPSWSTSVSPTIRFSDPGSIGITGGATNDHGEVTVSSLNLNPNNNVTVAYWMYYPSIPAVSSNAVVLKSSGLLQTGFIKGTGGPCTGVCLAAWNSGGGNAPLAYKTSPSSSAGWYHFAYTWDGTNSRLYINGVEATSTTNAPTSAVVSKVYLSTYDGTNEDFTGGKIDDVRVYSTALTAPQVQRLASGYLTSVAAPTYTLGGNTSVTGTFALTSGGITVGSYALTASSGLTVGGNGTLTMASSGGIVAIGNGQSLFMNGTLNASSTGATIKAVSGNYGFQVGSISTARPTLNVTGLAVKNTNTNGMWINANTGAVTTFTRFDNIAFSGGTGSQLLQIYAPSLFLSSSGCTFDSGAAATTSYTVRLTGNGTADGETRAIFGGSTCSNDFTSCQASKIDDDGNNNGVGDTPASNGAVVQFVRGAATDTAGTIEGFPTSAFDWNTFAYYSTYVAFHDASGTVDRVYVRDQTGTAKYAWDTPSGETIVGTPRWTTGGTTHYLYLALASGKVYRLVDNGSSLTPDSSGSWAGANNPFDCACTIISPLALDANNIHWGGTTSGPTQKVWTLGQVSRNQPTGSPFVITPVITSAAPALWTSGGTTYLFMGLAGNIIKLDVSNQVLDATNTNPGSAAIRGRVVPTSANRLFAGDDGGTMWALNPSSFGGTNKLWSYAVASDSIRSSPYYDYASTTVHFGTDGGKVIALNSSGIPLTGYPYLPGSTSDSIRSALLYAGGILVAGATTGKLYFLDRNNGTTGPALVRQYYFGPTEAVSGVGYDPGVSRYMVTTSDASTGDGRLYYIDVISDPTPSSP
jgi:hypothetical protein